MKKVSHCVLFKLFLNNRVFQLLSLNCFCHPQRYYRGINLASVNLSTFNHFIQKVLFHIHYNKVKLYVVILRLFLNNSELHNVSFQQRKLGILWNQDFVFFIFWVNNSKWNFLFFNYELVTQKWKNIILPIELVTRSETLYFSTSI